MSKVTVAALVQLTLTILAPLKVNGNIQYGKEGDNVTLSCSFGNHQEVDDLTYLWKKMENESAIIVADGSQTVDRKYEVKLLPLKKVFELRILNLTLEDEGEYQCQLINNNLEETHYNPQSIFLKIAPLQLNKSSWIFNVSDYVEALYEPELNFLDLNMKEPLPSEYYVEVWTQWTNTWTVDLLQGTPKDCKNVQEISENVTKIVMSPCVRESCSLPQILYPAVVNAKESGRNDVFMFISMPRKIAIQKGIINVLICMVWLFWLGLLSFMVFRWRHLKKKRRNRPPPPRRFDFDETMARIARRHQQRMEARFRQEEPGTRAGPSNKEMEYYGSHGYFRHDEDDRSGEPMNEDWRVQSGMPDNKSNKLSVMTTLV